MNYQVYILQCRNGAYYVGYTRDLKQRVLLHNQGRAATYTRQHGPVELLYSEPHPTEKSARTRERQIKKWTRLKKEALIKGTLTNSIRPPNESILKTQRNQNRISFPEKIKPQCFAWLDLYI